MLDLSKLTFWETARLEPNDPVEIQAGLTLNARRRISKDEIVDASMLGREEHLENQARSSLTRQIWALAYDEIHRGPLQKLLKSLPFLERFERLPRSEPYSMAAKVAAEAIRELEEMLQTPGPQPGPIRPLPVPRCRLCGYRASKDALEPASCPRDPDGLHDFTGTVIFQPGEEHRS